MGWRTGGGDDGGDGGGRAHAAAARWIDFSPPDVTANPSMRMMKHRADIGTGARSRLCPPNTGDEVCRDCRDEAFHCDLSPGDWRQIARQFAANLRRCDRSIRSFKELKG